MRNSGRGRLGNIGWLDWGGAGKTLRDGTSRQAAIFTSRSRLLRAARARRTSAEPRFVSPEEQLAHPGQPISGVATDGTNWVVAWWSEQPLRLGHPDHALRRSRRELGNRHKRERHGASPVPRRRRPCRARMHRLATRVGRRHRRRLRHHVDAAGRIRFLPDLRQQIDGRRHDVGPGDAAHVRHPTRVPEDRLRGRGRGLQRRTLDRGVAVVHEFRSGTAGNPGDRNWDIGRRAPDRRSVQPLAYRRVALTSGPGLMNMTHDITTDGQGRWLIAWSVLRMGLEKDRWGYSYSSGSSLCLGPSTK